MGMVCLFSFSRHELRWGADVVVVFVGSEEGKVALFREAAKVHIRRAKEAGNGMGVDRHMFGESSSATRA